MTRSLASFLACTSLALSLTGVAAAAEPNLAPVIDKLGSSNMRERVSALRDFSRMKVAPAKSRPILEKMIADPSADVRAEVVAAIPVLLGAGGTDLLEKLYGDPDRVVRDSSIREACKMWDQEKPRKLCTSAFGDPDYGARVEVLGVLRENFPRDPKAGELFRKGLSDASEQVQRSAVFGVQAARDKGAVPELGKLARNASTVVAIPAAEEALATIGTPEAVAELVKLLPKPKGEPGKPGKPEDLVRAAAARALERIKDKSSLPPLREMLKEQNATLKVAALGAVTAMKDKQSVPLIVPMLKDKETRVRQFALRALRQIGDPSPIDDVRRVLKEDADPNVRAGAANTLADLLGPKAIPDLLATKDDLAPEVRLEATNDLAGFGKPAASAIVVFLGDKSPDVRKMAIQGLGQVGGPENIKDIAAAAADTSKGNLQVRMVVAEALGAIRHVDALPALTKLAADAEPAVRQAAAVALGQIGGPKAQKILEPLLKDPVPAVRTAARKASDGIAAAEKK